MGKSKNSSKMKNLIKLTLEKFYLIDKTFPKLIIASLIFIQCTNKIESKPGIPEPIQFHNIEVFGDLQNRLSLNFNRLEEEKYQPDHIFLTNVQSNWWPGDGEGRTVLGLTLDAQASKKTPQYLQEIIARFPEHMNRKGYFGDIPPDSILDEQQLSSNGWVLRGLCEYYLWKQDDKVLAMINQMVDSLVLPTRGRHLSKYPIDPKKRSHDGGYSGSRYANPVNNWVLSSDIGCDFIFLDGVVQAYQVTKNEKIKPLIEEMIQLFLKIDLFEIKAQTHATLTALRASSRYYEISHQANLLPEIEKRYKLYREQGMTENFENYNWFQRPQWTEPCAIIDSYLLAVNLWRYTGKPTYLEDAQLIYYNGMGATQRFNGGFGCNSCSGADSPFLQRKVQEAHWCCTMRGGEGLSRAAQYLYFTNADTVYMNFYENNSALIELASGKIEIKEQTSYPFKGEINWEMKNPQLKAPLVFKIFIPSWANEVSLELNGKLIQATVKNSFITLNCQPTQGDKLMLRFEQQVKRIPTQNLHSVKGYFSLRFGPLILGLETKQELTLGKDDRVIISDNGLFLLNNQKALTPLFSQDSVSNTISSYSKQILFKQN
jgi:hypothetical protein